jgi:hypothetical protein
MLDERKLTYQAGNIYLDSTYMKQFPEKSGLVKMQGGGIRNWSAYLIVLNPRL